MCKALEELYQDGLDAGIEKGIEKGIEVGMKTGIETGIKTGIEKGIEALVLDNLEDGKEETVILSKIQKRFDLSEEEAIQYLRIYIKKA